MSQHRSSLLSSEGELSQGRAVSFPALASRRVDGHTLAGKNVRNSFPAGLAADDSLVAKATPSSPAVPDVAGARKRKRSEKDEARETAAAVPCKYRWDNIQDATHLIPTVQG